MKRILLWLIVFYQKQISPLHPGCCRFVPTCSEYALEAIQTWGAVRGLGLALWRVLRGYDPVPARTKTVGEEIL